MKYLELLFHQIKVVANGNRLFDVVDLSVGIIGPVIECVEFVLVGVDAGGHAVQHRHARVHLVVYLRNKAWNGLLAYKSIFSENIKLFISGDNDVKSGRKNQTKLISYILRKVIIRI